MLNSAIQNKDGLAMLITVIVILAFMLTLGLVSSKISINELAIDLDADNSNKALQMAESCSEEANFRLKLNSGYTGGSIAFDNGSCTISVSGAGGSRTIMVAAISDNVTRDLTVDVDLKANVATNAEGIDVTDWEEN